MADSLNPNTAAAVTEKLKEAEKLLSKMSDSSVSMAESFNLAKEAIKGMLARVKKSDLKSIGKDIQKDLEKATTQEEIILGLKKAQLKSAQLMSHASYSKLVTVKKVHDSITQALEKQSGALLEQVFSHSKMASSLWNNFKLAKQLPANMKATGAAFTAHFGKMGGVIGKMGAGVGGILTKVGIRLATMRVPVIGWIITGILLVKDLVMAFFKFAKSVFNVFKEADAAAAKFRMTMGTTRPFTRGIESDVRSMAINLKAVGVTFETVYNSVIALAQVMGSTTGYSRALVETASIFAAQLGVSAERSVQVFKTFAQIDRSTMRSQKNMVGFLAKLSAAGGTNLNEVMGDIAEFSQSHYRFMRGSSLEMAKTAVEARRMGTSITSAAKSASSLLNFTQSISDEMTASVLLGQSVDLQRARTFAYKGLKGIADLNKEILYLAQQHDFENMDPFQMEAFAKALGKTEEEIGKILLAEKERVEVQKSLDKSPELRKQAKLYEDMLQSSKERARNVGLEYVQELRKKANQEKMVAIQNQWNAMIQKLAEHWLPVIEDIMGGILETVKFISWAIQVAMSPFVSMAKIVSGLMKFFKGEAGAGRLIAKGITERILGPGGGFLFDKLYPETGEAAELAAERPTPEGFAATTSDMGRTYASAGDRESHRTALIVNSINGLRDDLKQNGISANLYVDSQRLRSASERAGRFLGSDGTLTTQPV